MLTQDTIPNFIGGVSQQPDKLMFPNQSKELLNMLPDPNAFNFVFSEIKFTLFSTGIKAVDLISSFSSFS